MAYDKLVDSAVLDSNLTAVADAIRAKGGTSGTMEFPDGFVSAVQGIQAGGGADTILGREYMSGSFTLAEDTTSNYEITDLTPFFDGASCNTVGLMFRERTSRESNIGMWCAVYQPKYKGNAVSGVSVGYAYSSETGSSAVKNGGLKEIVSGMETSKLVALFTSDHPGFAGETYSWLVLRYKKVV